MIVPAKQFEGEVWVRATDLQRAIAEAETAGFQQEPVAWTTGWHDGHCVIRAANPAAILPIGLALYTRPQAREPLTDEQLRKHWQVAKVLDMTDAEIDFSDYVLIARDVEALYGIKGEA